MLTLIDINNRDTDICDNLYIYVPVILKEVTDIRTRFSLPSDADLHDAAEAIVRLQDFYDLNLPRLKLGIVPSNDTRHGESEYGSNVSRVKSIDMNSSRHSIVTGIYYSLDKTY